MKFIQQIQMSAREFKETKSVTVLGLVTQLKKKDDDSVNRWDELY